MESLLFAIALCLLAIEWFLSCINETLKRIAKKLEDEL